MNRLAGAVSPYLRQHAHNPVEWYPWGDEALALARAGDRPLFVSIGYAACHWCHVMAHESFEDEAVAADLNRSFVAVKVDREERPDVDAVYMAAVQSMTGSGGWPMSVFCTPDGRPFFAGTYFPPVDRHQMPGFRRVLAAVAEAWHERRAGVEAQADALADAVRADLSLVDRLGADGMGADGPGGDGLGGDGMGGDGPGGDGMGADGPGGDGMGRDAGLADTGLPHAAAVMDRLAADLAARFDPHWGGFGPAPKFPRPTLVELCLRRHRATGDPGALQMATTTLDAMAAGGIYDHLAGGFARYSTDSQWTVPHFEKMLSDQALLARAYLHAWQCTGSAQYRQVAVETLDAAWDELANAEGTLGSSLDADAAGDEGGHAVWTPAEVRAALEAAGCPELADDACRWYGVTDEGNFEGRTVLSRPPGAPLVRPPGIETARRALLEARRRRPQPGRDDKVLTEWNAMYFAVLAESAAACDHAAWARRAEAGMDALTASNRRPDGRWLRVAGGEVPAFAADLAWVAECCTRLAELTGRARWSEAAGEAATQLMDRCWDDRRGGLFSTGDDAERLIARAKEVLDGAVPSAASIGAQALLRVGSLCGSERARLAGERLVALDGPLLREQPMAVADMVPALLFAGAPTEVVVTGDRPDLLAAVRRHWLPGAVVAWGEPTAPALWAGRSEQAAYVCHRFACAAPAHDPATLSAQLERHAGR